MGENKAPGHFSKSHFAVLMFMRYKMAFRREPTPPALEAFWFEAWVGKVLLLEKHN